MAWMSIIFFNRDAINKWEATRWLPDVPALGQLMSISSEFQWNEECYQEVLLLGRASGYSFATFLENLELPRNSYGSCFANPITVDTTSVSSPSFSSHSEDFPGGPVIPDTCSGQNGGDVQWVQVLGGLENVGDGHGDAHELKSNIVRPRTPSMKSASGGEPNSAHGLENLGVDAHVVDTTADEETSKEESIGSVWVLAGGRADDHAR